MTKPHQQHTIDTIRDCIKVLCTNCIGPSHSMLAYCSAAPLYPMLEENEKTLHMGGGRTAPSPPAVRAEPSAEDAEDASLFFASVRLQDILEGSLPPGQTMQEALASYDAWTCWALTTIENHRRATRGPRTTMEEAAGDHHDRVDDARDGARDEAIIAAEETQ